MRSGEARGLWWVSPGVCEWRATSLPGVGEAQALVRTLHSGVSRGTERLVAGGHVPARSRDTMRGPRQRGDFPFPVQYGYAAVGVVEAGPGDWPGSLVFALHPHQDRFVLPISELHAVPAGVPARRATLAANMETALNALWDGGAGPGDRIVVVGGGVVGLLVVALAARLPGADVLLLEPDPARAAIGRALGAQVLVEPMRADADIAFHCSGTEAGLAAALDVLGLEGALVEMSWHGDRAVSVQLGGPFHDRRLRIVSSQVGQVSPSRRPRWTHGRRLGKALDLLQDGRLDALLTHEVAAEDAPAALPAMLAAESGALGITVRYGQAPSP